MGRVYKTSERLDKLERGFRDRLVKELRACVDGKRELLFLTQEFRPMDLGSSQYPTWVLAGFEDGLPAFMTLNLRVNCYGSVGLASTDAGMTLARSRQSRWLALAS